jgi:hypothetical protein
VDALENEMAPTRRSNVWIDQDGKPAFAATFQINKRWKQEQVEAPTIRIGDLKINEGGDGNDAIMEEKKREGDEPDAKKEEADGAKEKDEKE